MGNVIEVTVKMHQEQLIPFLNKNGIEEYTWRKGQITIDMTSLYKGAVAELPKKQEKKEEPKPQTPPAESAKQPDKQEGGDSGLW